MGAPQAPFLIYIYIYIYIYVDSRNATSTDVLLPLTEARQDLPEHWHVVGQLLGRLCTIRNHYNYTDTCYLVTEAITMTTYNYDYNYECNNYSSSASSVQEDNTVALPLSLSLPLVNRRTFLGGVWLEPLGLSTPSADPTLLCMTNAQIISRRAHMCMCMCMCVYIYIYIMCIYIYIYIHIL